MLPLSRRLTWCWLLVLALLGVPTLRADEAEDKAVAFVQKLGGKVERDEKAPGKPVVAVSLTFIKVKDAELKELAPLKNLHTLDLTGTQVGDVGLKGLAPLKNLHELQLGGTQVGDAGLKELAALKNLKFVDLGATKVTAAGVKELQMALPKCKILHPSLKCE
jgi:hypothetical protein